MSRTTSREAKLTRLVVSGLAAVTLIAGAPAFLGAAQANHAGPATGVEITPPTATAAAGTCQLFRIDVFANNTTSSSNPAVKADSTTVDVVLTERTASGTQDVSFCTAPTGPTTPAAPTNGTNSGPAGSTDRAEFTTDNNGTVFIGVVGVEAGIVDIQVFLDQNNNNARDLTEAQDTSVLTLTQGGADAVNCVDATPEDDTNVVGETHVITARLTTNSANNSANVPDSGAATCAGETVAGVTPTAVFTDANGVTTAPPNNSTIT
ncbi:MAG TPA: hypothetical protein VNA30_01955, partial [Mycobacteriales bacterium]|nr:hypothetical protein [Mycobacteriales bacterium]